MNNLIDNKLFKDALDSFMKLNKEYQTKLCETINQLESERGCETPEHMYFCVRCGKPIKQIDSINLSMGPICYQKYCQEHKKRTKKLF